MVVGFARAGLGLEVVVRELSGVVKARVLPGSRALGINFFFSFLILLRLTKASAACDGPERA